MVCVGPVFLRHRVRRPHLSSLTLGRCVVSCTPAAAAVVCACVRVCVRVGVRVCTGVESFDPPRDAGGHALHQRARVRAASRRRVRLPARLGRRPARDQRPRLLRTQRYSVTARVSRPWLTVRLMMRVFVSMCNVAVLWLNA